MSGQSLDVIPLDMSAVQAVVPDTLSEEEDVETVLVQKKEIMDTDFDPDFSPDEHVG